MDEMKLQIREFARLTSVSVRTLHYYDEIGLLKPGVVDKHTGYRYYDEDSLQRMQEILFYRELDFSLKSIQEILSSPDYDRKAALQEQKRLLTLKKERIERLITALDEAEKGTGKLSMKVFDNREFENARNRYAEEAKQKWGKTDAWKESTEKTKGYTADKWTQVNLGMGEIFAAFSECMKSGVAADEPNAQELVKKWQDYITENFYHCTKEILRGLGQMYVADERFTWNIDKYGEGTAAYMSKAIAHFCS